MPQPKNVLEIAATDSEFDHLLYPISVKSLSSAHWTPIRIAMLAAEWLAPFADIKVLDVGSGVGKFCIVGAIHTKGQFTGVEHRPQLVQQAKKAVKKAEVSNVEFLLADMASIDFSQFDCFYFFNPFYENIVPDSAIDNDIELSVEKYQDSMKLVYEKLDQLKVGTRVATFCSSDTEIPPSYELVSSAQESKELRFWVKR